MAAQALMDAAEIHDFGIEIVANHMKEQGFTDIKSQQRFNRQSADCGAQEGQALFCDRADGALSPSRSTG